MANAVHKNTIFVDSTGDITVTALKPILYGIILTPSADSCRIVIKESSSAGTTKVDLKIVATESRMANFAPMHGIELTSTFNITTMTNITSMILIGSWYTPVGKARE